MSNTASPSALYNRKRSTVFYVWTFFLFHDTQTTMREGVRILCEGLQLGRASIKMVPCWNVRVGGARVTWYAKMVLYTILRARRCSPVNSHEQAVGDSLERRNNPPVQLTRVEESFQVCTSAGRQLPSQAADGIYQCGFSCVRPSVLTEPSMTPSLITSVCRRGRPTITGLHYGSSFECPVFSLCWKLLY